MQIVIDIDDNRYTRLFDNGIQDNEIATDDICEMARSIRIGTPLPKGHGRLIDADELKTAFPTCDNSLDIKVANVRATINHVPTIIVADKESKE